MSPNRLRRQSESLRGPGEPQPAASAKTASVCGWTRGLSGKNPATNASMSHITRLDTFQTACVCREKPHRTGCDQLAGRKKGVLLYTSYKENREL